MYIVTDYVILMCAYATVFYIEWVMRPVTVPVWMEI